MAITVTEELYDLKLSLTSPVSKKTASYSKFINTADDEQIFEFARGIMSLQANPGTDVYVKRDYLLTSN